MIFFLNQVNYLAHYSFICYLSRLFFTVNIDYYFLKCYTDFFIGYLFVVINVSELVL